MSEYQYYEFQSTQLRERCCDRFRPATSFINDYEWGDLRGDPRKFMEEWFDLHLYLADWSMGD
jgi:hypothetical protein